jgi:twitching motility protein PilJ
MSNTLVIVHIPETVQTIAASGELIPRYTDSVRGLIGSQHVAGFDPARLGIRFGVVGLLALVAIVTLVFFDSRARLRIEQQTAREARQREEEIAAANRRGQEAILKLLDEISALADGDLTTQATVTEDITGAIADAVNYSIEALREIVANINDTAAEVRGAARMTRERALVLSDASETQTQRITEGTVAIQAMNESVDAIAARAEESREVSSRSVVLADRGANAVQATISGMDIIRETIQETSKRIKRLGESSQEIGDIVGLIDDIADQTNVLALNAAIQATMAGEAGRGFAVVADEVQRLAERAGQATKQIDALVKAIQSDTHEAVASMEQTTEGVVSGARLAQGAGESLTEIETVSEQLAEQVTAISELSRTHSEQAAEIQKAMQAIQAITNQTHQGTLEAADAVGDLAELGDALRESVEGFRLPERDFEATVTLPQQLAIRRAAKGRSASDSPSERGSASAGDQEEPSGTSAKRPDSGSAAHSERREGGSDSIVHAGEHG